VSGVKRILQLCLLVMALWLNGVDRSGWAQGLIWSLPKDGTWVRYEGSYQQIEIRPDSTEGNLTIDWIRHLTIKSVGQESAEYAGQKVPCRWIEIKVQTGKPSEAGIDSGPIGERVNPRIYKVLVPESAITGKQRDLQNIPIAFLPIVRGYRKIGDKNAEELQTKVLHLYPSICLIRQFETLEAEGAGSEDPDVGVGPVTATRCKGNFELESSTTRSVHEAQLWRSENVPFGLAKWIVKIHQEQKAANEPRSAFRPAVDVSEEMKAQATGTDAKSELAVP
jgi:hypothetical protein